MFVVAKIDRETNTIKDLWRISEELEPSKYEQKKAEEFAQYFTRIDGEHLYEIRYINMIPDLNNKSE
jgi:hypothetical protein